MATRKRSPVNDMAGERYGRLSVIEYVKYGKWLCVCDCGNRTAVHRSALLRGLTKSCGCLHRDVVTKHNMADTLVYAVWAGMLARCLNPKHRAYRNYGGRGIAVCESWRDFSAFNRDMGLRPPGGTLERIDNDQGYSPENCRWATRADQARNQRNNRPIMYAGKTQTLAEWAREVGLLKSTLRARLKAGWPLADALTKPSRKGGPKGNTTCP